MGENTCFHCGLAVLEAKPPVLHVQEQQKAFCCHGCKAVCHAIVSSGNVDYYHHREGNARTFNTSELPKLLNKLTFYDNESLQKEFIRLGKGEGNKEWKEAWLILEEIRCAACLWLNEKTLRQLDGVIDVQMDYTSQQARVRWDPSKVKLSDILAAITTIGYVAHPFDPSQRESLNQAQKQRSIQRILFALILGMAVMQSAIGGYFFNQQDTQGNYPLWITISRWANVVSTFLILAYPGQLFFQNAWRDLKNKSLGMDVPIAIGLSIAWLGSLYGTLNGSEDVYFESIAMFVIFLLIARHIELRTRITATALLDRSAKIIPQVAKLIDHGEIKEIPVVELEKRDRIQILPGETVPLDGKLLSESSSFDESLLTGESLPVMRRKGEHVLGGSVNVDQLIEVEVLSNKTQSVLNRIHQLTQQSINSRPYYVDLAERVAGKFVATILLIATATFLFWNYHDSSYALSYMISVLIVTCPCALALAAPVSLSLGAAGLSRLHMLPIRMSAIEELSHIDTIVFDKTGTLTAGTPAVESIKLVGTTNKKDCLSIAASMEQGSKHPFAKAILSKATKENINYQDIELHHIKHVSGEGVKASISLNKLNQDSKLTCWKLGSDTFTNFSIAVISNELQTQIREWRGQGSSVLFLSNDDGLQAVFCITDTLRNGVKAFISDIDNLGLGNIHKAILSGDHKQSVMATATSLGITDAHGGLSPQEKLDWIRREQDKGRKVMMIGDGINDAPTLASADVALTFTEATDLAKKHCDFILLGKDYKNLRKAFLLMQQTRKIILQNLGWAITYNILAIPAAVAGLVTPWMAAIGMSLSSLIVVVNSLRLRSFINGK